MELASVLAETVSLRFHFHTSVLLVMGGVGVFFWWAFTRLGPNEIEPGEVVSTARERAWIRFGFVITFVFSYWPLHDIAERYLFLAHMTQHTVFTLVSPACFLLGSPPWLWRWALRHRGIRAFTRFGAKPVVALMVFNSLIAVTHYPAVVERSLHNEFFHFSVHFILFASATLMWIPVINRNPDLPRLRTPVKMMYLFAQSIVPTVPASFLTFSSTPLYKTYQEAPRMIRSLTAIGDQQIAAAIMKLGAGFLLWSVVGMLFLQWWRDSRDGLEDDRSMNVSDAVHRAKPTAKPQIAGMTVTGKRIIPDVLTWDAVKAEFDSIDAAQKPAL